jgi:predicted enzyme related to lactoylglutathione lyase
MTIRTSPWPPGVPCWTDIGVEDVTASCAFYSAVLGWDFPAADTASGGFAIASVDGQAVAAIGPKQSPDQPTAWMLYFASDDADQTAQLITESGGTMLLPPGDVGDFGRLLIALDPTGAAFGVWQAKSHIGAGLVNAPGGIAWEDLRCTDPDAARAFYHEVFGFDYQPVEMAPPDYTTFHLAGEDAPRGGIGGFMTPQPASHWEVYFGVADTDAAAAAVGPAGGMVVMGPVDTPFGRLAGIIDPSGAPFLAVATANPQD